MAEDSIQYVVSENGAPNRVIIFESAAQTDEGIMRAAAKAVAGTIPDEADQMPHGYSVFRSTAIGHKIPKEPDTQEEEPTQE
jgi:hypothetical protein